MTPCKFIPTLLFLAASHSYADHIVELNGTLSTGTGEVDAYFSDQEFNTHGSALDATIYIKRIGTRNRPYRESGFLSKTTSFNVKYDRLTTEFDRGTERTETNRKVSVRGVLPLGIILGGGYEELEDDFNEFTFKSVTVGAYASKSDAISFTYETLDSEFNDNNPRTISLEYKGVRALSNNRAFNLEVRGYHTDSDNIFNGERSGVSGQAKMYFTPRIGFGVNWDISVFDSNNTSERARVLIAPEFSADFNERLGIQLTLSSIGESWDNGDSSANESELELTLNGRF